MHRSYARHFHDFIDLVIFRAWMFHKRKTAQCFVNKFLFFVRNGKYYWRAHAYPGFQRRWSITRSSFFSRIMPIQAIQTNTPCYLGGKIDRLRLKLFVALSYRPMGESFNLTSMNRETIKKKKNTGKKEKRKKRTRYYKSKTR